MLKIISTLFVILSSLAVSCQVTLNIVIKNLNNNEGTVLVDFRDVNDQSLKSLKGRVSNNESTIVVDSLEIGKYSFRYFHDENDNQKLDTY
jgi:uncharacterized protein (DUF2141 family)